MPAQWTGELIGKMHIYGITSIELAKKVNYNPKYLSSVLNGKRSPEGAKNKLFKALEELLVEKETVECNPL